MTVNPTPRPYVRGETVHYGDARVFEGSVYVFVRLGADGFVTQAVEEETVAGLWVRGGAGTCNVVPGTFDYQLASWDVASGRYVPRDRHMLNSEMFGGFLPPEPGIDFSGSHAVFLDPGLGVGETAEYVRGQPGEAQKIGRKHILPWDVDLHLDQVDGGVVQRMGLGAGDAAINASTGPNAHLTASMYVCEAVGEAPMRHLSVNGRELITRDLVHAPGLVVYAEPGIRQIAHGLNHVAVHDSGQLRLVLPPISLASHGATFTVARKGAGPVRLEAADGIDGLPAYGLSPGEWVTVVLVHGSGVDGYVVMDAGTSSPTLTYTLPFVMAAPYATVFPLGEYFEGFRILGMMTKTRSGTVAYDVLLNGVSVGMAGTSSPTPSNPTPSPFPVVKPVGGRLDVSMGPVVAASYLEMNFLVQR